MASGTCVSGRTCAVLASKSVPPSKLNRCPPLVPPDIRESVDSLCRDGTDTPYTQYKINVSKSLQKISFKLYRDLTFIFLMLYSCSCAASILSLGSHCYFCLCVYISASFAGVIGREGKREHPFQDSTPYHLRRGVGGRSATGVRDSITHTGWGGGFPRALTLRPTLRLLLEQLRSGNLLV